MIWGARRWSNPDEYTVSICAKDGSGPYHKELKSHLINLCKINDIPYKVDIYPYYSSDASAALKQVQTFVMVYLVV